MKSRIKLLLVVLFLITTANIYGQAPQNKKFGFGIMLGDPTGGTVKIWTQHENAFVIDLGSSYFGSPRLGADYLWHFNAFNSRIANLYAGPGAVLGFGEGSGFWYKNKFVRTGSSVGVGIRGVFGVDVVPERTPLEIFGEIGVLVGFSPSGSSVDAAIGLRFYP